MFEQMRGARVVFSYRGVECWTKVISGVPGWPDTHCGYFYMAISGVVDTDGLDRLFVDNGGRRFLPNGGRFSYLVPVAGDAVVAGFDGMHDHNQEQPLSDADAQAQIRAAVDFLLDSGRGDVVAVAAHA